MTEQNYRRMITSFIGCLMMLDFLPVYVEWAFHDHQRNALLVGQGQGQAEQGQVDRADHPQLFQRAHQQVRREAKAKEKRKVKPNVVVKSTKNLAICLTPDLPHCLLQRLALLAPIMSQDL